VKLKRLAPRYYITADGEHEVIGYYLTADEARGYGAGWRWYFRPVGGEAHDIYSTKREAVAALEATKEQ